MRTLIFNLLLRIAKGERYEKSATLESRCQMAVFAFIPIFLEFIYLGHPLLHGANMLMMGLCLLISFILTVFIIAAWAMFIPPKASLIGSVILWVLTIWVASHLDLAEF